MRKYKKLYCHGETAAMLESALCNKYMMSSLVQ